VTERVRRFWIGLAGVAIAVLIAVAAVGKRLPARSFDQFAISRVWRPDLPAAI
jgi:hypothetical protein